MFLIQVSFTLFMRTSIDAPEQIKNLTSVKSNFIIIMIRSLVFGKLRRTQHRKKLFNLINY